MSYVRFRYDSDVYIYDDVDGATRCCGCLLGEDPRTTDLTVMLAHVQAHRAAGHKVPRWVEEALRDDWPAEGER